MSNQLVKKNPAEGYQNIFPKTWIDAIKDKESGVSLQEILQGFNMYFLSYNGSRALTRCKVPSVLRKEGLWITYVLYDHTVVTEWYNSDQIDDNSWSMDSNWRIASNNLVGDVSVSADGYWVINGEKTESKAQGEQGVTPLLRVGANSKLQVSYNAGKAWKDISDYIVPRFKWNQGTGTSAGTIQISMDLGKTWTNLSNEITNNLRISRYIGINESLPTSGVAEGTIYMKGPYYDESDTSHTNPIYRMWIYAWKGNTLAWQDNGEFTSISTIVVQERGNSTTEVMSQDAITRELTKLESEVIYDVTANNNGATFTSLSALLSDKNLSTLIPSSKRYGGMSIRFVQSSDNKYMQYRLMATSFSTTEADWQKEDSSQYVSHNYRCFDRWGAYSGDTDSTFGSIAMTRSQLYKSFLYVKFIGLEDGIYALQNIVRFPNSRYRFILEKYNTSNQLWTSNYAIFETYDDIENNTTENVCVFDVTNGNYRMIAVIDFSYWVNEDIGSTINIDTADFVFNKECFVDYYGIVDNLTTNSSTLPLSAKQGKVLKEQLENAVMDDDVTVERISNNIANPENIQLNTLINNRGEIDTENGWDMISVPVSEGDIITVGGFILGRAAYYAYYNGSTLVSFGQLQDPQGTVNPTTFTIPSGVNILYVDIKTSTTGSEYTNLMINYGSSLLDYDTYEEVITKINNIKISGADIANVIADLPVSDGVSPAISEGHAYIDSSTYIVKVKHSV